MNTSRPVLRITNLSVAYRHGGDWLEALREVNLEIEPGQTFGLVGESGSGKTTLALAIMRYLGENGRIQQGKIELAGVDLCTLSESEMTNVWGSKATMVPQDPLSSLNPAIKIGEQLTETLRQHLGMSVIQARERAEQQLTQVRIPDPSRVMELYPHQLSGGMQQRMMIAMALSTEPLLLILDEPTTNLDVTTQAVVLDLIRDLIQDQNTAVLYVTHNLGVVANLCDRVAVLYSGELVEVAGIGEIFHQPLHPYTQGLIDSVPLLGQTKDSHQIRSIQGQIPPMDERPEGCIFSDRCPLAIEICQQRPELFRPLPSRQTRCHRWEEILGGEIDPRQPLPSRPEQTGKLISEDTVLAIEGLEVGYPVRRSVSEILTRQKPQVIRAVNGVSLKIGRGQTLGLVGESGSGKTTLSRALVGLVHTSAGEMYILAALLPSGFQGRDLDILRQLQMVFQNPEEALNPYMTVGESLRRPLINLLSLSQKEADREVGRMLEAVHLPASFKDRLPNQLSGGEKQRVAIARAFASNPDLLIFDEAVSALDVSVQASILNLLNDLQAEHHTSQLFISHDLSVVGFIADQVAVIYLGQLMEVADAGALYEPPYHPYTEALLSAIPLPDPESRQERIRLSGDVPSPLNIPGGCPFHTRCPRVLGEICRTETPQWQEHPTGKRIFCHIPAAELLELQSQAISLSETGE